MSHVHHSLARQSLSLLLPPVLESLRRQLRDRIPPSGPFPDVRCALHVPGSGAILHLAIVPLEDGPRRALTLESAPKDRSHHSTRYLFRGTNREILDHLDTVTPDAWADLVLDACDACARFYYP